MFEELLASDDLRTALVGAAFGTLATVLVQYVVHRYRLFMAFKRFRHDLRNLDRHIQASLKSLELPQDAPRYLIAARLRFCKFLDGMRSVGQLEWLTRRRDSDRILPTLLAIRNSDLFLEEIASRIDAMPDDAVPAALDDARTNLRFLEHAIKNLGYAHVAVSEKDYRIPVETILKNIRTEDKERI